MTTPLNAGNKGLANLGNTCYMNSALQCLSHILCFHPHNKVFESICVDLDDCLMKEWFSFQQQMWSNEERGMINPMKLLQCFQQNCQDHGYYFENFQQNDADEFLRLFFDILHQGIKRHVSLPDPSTRNTDQSVTSIIQKSDKVWKTFYDKDYSYIIQTFSSQLLQITSCPECAYYTTNHDPVQVMSIEIPDQATSLLECLQANTRKTQLDERNQWICDECHQSVQPYQRTLWWKTSDIIILLLKRYTRTHKIDTHLTFSEILDLEGLSMNSDELSMIYELQGFCVHRGSLGGGHYLAVCKNHIDKRWYEYNDTHVTEVSPDTMKSYRPYIFFYRRT